MTTIGKTDKSTLLIQPDANEHTQQAKESQAGARLEHAQAPTEAKGARVAEEPAATLVREQLPTLPTAEPGLEHLPVSQQARGDNLRLASKSSAKTAGETSDGQSIDTRLERADAVMNDATSKVDGAFDSSSIDEVISDPMADQDAIGQAMADLTNTIESLSSAIADLDSMIQLLNGVVKELMAEQAELNKAKKETVAHIKTLKADLEQLKKELQDALLENLQIKSAGLLGASGIAASDEKVALLTAKVSLKQAELKKAEDHLARLEKKIAKVEEKISDTKAKIKNCNKKRRAAEEKLRDAQRKSHELQRKQNEVRKKEGANRDEQQAQSNDARQADRTGRQVVVSPSQRTP